MCEIIFSITDPCILDQVTNTLIVLLCKVGKDGTFSKLRFR